MRSTAVAHASAGTNNALKTLEADVLFDGTFDGLMCVVYAYYYEGLRPQSIQSDNEYQPSITFTEHFVITQPDRAARVETAIRNKISEEAARRVYLVSLSAAPDRFMVLLHYIAYGFKIGHRVDDHMQLDFILRVHKLAREVGCEAHKLTGFCRFAETQQGVYYCAITPTNHVLHPLADFFADRMIDQSWVIHDKNRHKAAVYNGREYTFVTVNPGTAPPAFVENEGQIQDLWVMYFNTLAIEARKNPKLQRRVLPKRFRGNMVEFIKV